MYPTSGALRKRNCEGGATLYIVALALVIMLGISALAIDLVSFYVGRNEAQRAADAAALAGASVFANQGCVSVASCVAGGPQEAPAKQQALDVVAQNLVVGQAPSTATVDVSFSYPKAEEPQITVTVHRDSAKSNPLPTFFGKIFGIASVDVSASATAEAYTATGVSCLRPFLVPNCDPDHETATSGPETNTNCGTAGLDTATGMYYTKFLDPNLPYPSIVSPGVYDPTSATHGGIIGEPWVLHTAAGPSQWYMIAFTGQGASINNGLGSYIATCAPLVVACGTQQTSYNGATAGPVAAGVEQLIHASGSCFTGQDTICSPTSSPACSTQPFTITGGANNPNPNLVGQTISGPSDSLMTVAIYDGTNLGPGGNAVTVIGYMQMFVEQVTKSPGNPCAGNGTDVHVVVINVTICGPGGGGGGLNSQGSPIPIRLIHQ